MTAGICLALVTIISGIAKSQLSINVWISTFSYLGVYAIALYLSRNDGGEKIILTLIDFLAIVILVAYAFVAVERLPLIAAIAVVPISLCGTVCAGWSVWLNNTFRKDTSDDSRKHQ